MSVVHVKSVQPLTSYRTSNGIPGRSFSTTLRLLFTTWFSSDLLRFAVRTTAAPVSIGADVVSTAVASMAVSVDPMVGGCELRHWTERAL